MAGAQDAQRDLAAVGDDDFIEHGNGEWMPLITNEKRLVELDRLPLSHWMASTVPETSASIGLEHLHRLDDAQRLAGLDRLADADERRFVRRRATDRRCRPSARAPRGRGGRSPCMVCEPPVAASDGEFIGITGAAPARRRRGDVLDPERRRRRPCRRGRAPGVPGSPRLPDLDSARLDSSSRSISF